MKKVKIITLGLFLALILNPLISFANTNAGKTMENGIYKIAVGRDSNKSIEVPGENHNNNTQIGIWNYRQWFASTTIF